MKKLSLILGVCLLLAACRSQQLIRPGDTLEVAYQKAFSLYEEERWRDAVSAFETVIRIGRGTEIGQDAQYYLAESHYNNRHYLMAASEYERYSATFPDSERREEVDYKTALCYYRLSPRHNIDQQHTEIAIERFRLFLVRYPGSDWLEDAGRRIDRHRVSQEPDRGVEAEVRPEPRPSLEIGRIDRGRVVEVLQRRERVGVLGQVHERQVPRRPDRRETGRKGDQPRHPLHPPRTGHGTVYRPGTCPARTPPVRGLIYRWTLVLCGPRMHGRLEGLECCSLATRSLGDRG